MYLTYIGSSDIEQKKKLLSWFYPKLRVTNRITVSNKDKKLVKIIGKNPNIAKLVEKLDLMQVE